MERTTPENSGGEEAREPSVPQTQERLQRPLLPLTAATMLPPPRPDDPINSSSSGSRKRKHDDSAAVSRSQSVASHSTATSSRISESVGSDFSTATKNKIRRRDGGYCCWHCRARPVQFAHVIERADPDVRFGMEDGSTNKG